MQFHNIFKVLVCSSLLVLSGLAFAGKGTSSSKSMSRGFSSNRSAPSMNSSRPSSSSFGSFQKKAKVTANSGGAFSRDLSRRQAQVNAMKAWDDKHRKNTSQSVSGTPLPPSSVGNSRYQERSVPSGYPPVNASPSLSKPTVSTSNGSNMNGVIAGMVLGQILSQPRTVYANGNGQTNSGGGIEPITTEGEFKQSQIAVEQPSDTLRAADEVRQKLPNEPVTSSVGNKPAEDQRPTSALAYMVIVAVIAAVVWYVRRRMKAAMQAVNRIDAKPHYSL